MVDPASLQNLHPIVEPPAAPWWPPAPGWYVLAGVIAVSGCVLAARAVRRRRDEAYRRAALTEFTTLATRAAAAEGDGEAMHALAVLLKRAALAAFPRERVARLSGPEWWEFLDATAGGSAFADGAGSLLARVAYDSSERLDPLERQALLDATETWLRRHHRGSAGSSC